MSEFEGFMDYCCEDSEDIKTWLADYFDLPNRTIPLTNSEIAWITANLSEDNQKDILGYTIKQYLTRKDK